MRGFDNYKRYLEGRVSRITPGRTCGLLYHLPEGYPALLPGNETVVGEIMEPVDEDLLQTLDWLEDYDEQGSDNLYTRELRSVLTDDGEKATCWIYIYNNERYAREKGTLVPGGDWRKFMEKKSR